MKYPGDESEQKWWKVCKLNITKILLREIKDINKMKDIPCSCTVDATLSENQSFQI